MTNPERAVIGFMVFTVLIFICEFSGIELERLLVTVFDFGMMISCGLFIGYWLCVVIGALVTGFA